MTQQELETRAKHGTPSRYTRGKCRCAPCRAAKAEYDRRYRPQRAKQSYRPRISKHRQRREAALAEHAENIRAGFSALESLCIIKDAYRVTWRTLGRWGLPVPFELQFSKGKRQLSAPVK